VRILGVDTATSTASVALIEDEALLAEEIYGAAAPGETKKNHAEIILPLIQSLLSRARVALADLSGIAVSIGPGSFTGLRIGLATVKGLVYDSGLPAVGVSTLLATAATTARSDGAVCALLDARKREVYFGLFRWEGKTLCAIGGETVTSIQSAVESLRPHASAGAPLLAVGDGARVYEKILRDALDGGLTLAKEGKSSVAAQAAFLARERLACAASDDVGGLLPVYLRRPEAESKKMIPSR
jgi:tRNA threonylcarbamoyladenosine biosynthesis protein TsaB